MQLKHEVLLKYGPRHVLTVPPTAAAAIGGCTWAALLGMLELERAVLPAPRDAGLRVIDLVVDAWPVDRKAAITGCKVLLLDDLGQVPSFYLWLLDYVYARLTEGRLLAENVQVLACGNPVGAAPWVGKDPLNGRLHDPDAPLQHLQQRDVKPAWEWALYPKLFGGASAIILGPGFGRQGGVLARGEQVPWTALLRALAYPSSDWATGIFSHVHDLLAHDLWPGNTSPDYGHPTKSLHVVGTLMQVANTTNAWVLYMETTLGIRVWREPLTPRGKVPFKGGLLRLAVGARVRAATKFEGFLVLEGAPRCVIPGDTMGKVMAVPPAAGPGTLRVLFRLRRGLVLVDVPYIERPAVRGAVDSESRKPTSGVPLRFMNVPPQPRSLVWTTLTETTHRARAHPVPARACCTRWCPAPAPRTSWGCRSWTPVLCRVPSLPAPRDVTLARRAALVHGRNYLSQAARQCDNMSGANAMVVWRQAPSQARRDALLPVLEPALPRSLTGSDRAAPTRAALYAERAQQLLPAAGAEPRLPPGLGDRGRMLLPHSVAAQALLSARRPPTQACQSPS